MGSLLVAALILLVVVSLFYGKKDEPEKTVDESKVKAKLKLRYENALRSGDKNVARQYGHDYYAYLRNSRSLDPADEQAIENDLANLR